MFFPLIQKINKEKVGLPLIDSDGYQRSLMEVSSIDNCH